MGTLLPISYIFMSSIPKKRHIIHSQKIPETLTIYFFVENLQMSSFYFKEQKPKRKFVLKKFSVWNWLLWSFALHSFVLVDLWKRVPVSKSISSLFKKRGRESMLLSLFTNKRLWANRSQFLKKRATWVIRWWFKWIALKKREIQ